jgi:BolA family transcriptional regulator, general stress-responsive regulator
VSVAEIIKDKVQAELVLTHFDLLNESHMHAGPATASHFKLIAVSDEFASLSLVKRHQRIYKILRDELAGEVHALALHLYSLDEWAKSEGAAPNSPKCTGNNK